MLAPADKIMAMIDVISIQGLVFAINFNNLNKVVVRCPFISAFLFVTALSKFITYFFCSSWNLAIELYRSLRFINSSWLPIS